MKRLLSIIFIATLLASCTGNLSKRQAEELAQTAYSEGDSLLHQAKKSPEGLRRLLEADTYAQQCDNDTLKAQILYSIAGLYYQHYKPGDALRYYGRALENALASANERWIQKCRLGLGVASHGLNQHEEAIETLTPVAGYARAVGDDALLQYALSFIGNSHAHAERYDEAINTFRTMQREVGLGRIDSCILLYSLAKAHRFDEYLELDRTFTLPADNSQLAFAREAYYEEIGDKDNLYVQSEIVANSIADTFYDSYNDGILNSVEQHFNTEQELKTRQLESQRTLTWVISVASLIIILMIVVGALLYHRYRMRLKDTELQLAVTQLREITQAENLSAQRNRELRSDIGDLFKNQWSTLNVLCNEYFEKGDTPLRKTILVEMEREIKRISEPAGMRHLAEALDRHFDNIITRLREQLPDLSEKDLAFLIFSYAGFSPRAICLFSGYTLKYYYKKRAVMKERLAASGAPDAQLFVDFLG